MFPVWPPTPVQPPVSGPRPPAPGPVRPPAPGPGTAPGPRVFTERCNPNRSEHTEATRFYRTLQPKPQRAHRSDAFLPNAAARTAASTQKRRKQKRTLVGTMAHIVVLVWK